MIRSSHGQISESFWLGASLSVVGGFLDAYTYLTRGHVFANAQTGNIVLMGLNLAELKFAEAFYYFIPVLAFLAGVLAAELIRKKFQSHPNIHWRQVIIAAEILVLVIVAFLPQGSFDLVVNSFISFLCSMQVESFRKINGNVYTTTMCTGNLRSATETLFRYFISKDKNEKQKSLQYYAIILFFIIGAVGGSFLIGLFTEKSILFCCLILFFVFLSMFIKQEHLNPVNSRPNTEMDDFDN